MGRYRAYGEYRESGVEWLGVIPKDWDLVRLKFAAELSGDKINAGTDEKYVGLENIESGNGVYLEKEAVTPEGQSSSFANGDVLFGKLRPYLAKSWLANFSGICSSEFLVLKSKKVSSRFLNYYTLTTEFINQVDSSTYGSKMPRASWDFIGLLAVPVPVDESEAIANFLDHETAKIDRLIAKQQQLIQLLKEKRQAVISHAVTKGLNPNAPMRDSGVEWLGEVPEGWDIRAVSKLSNKITNGYVGPTRDILFPEGVPYVQATHIKKGSVNFDGAYFVSQSWSAAHSKSILVQGDVLIVQTGAGTGDIGLVSENEVGFNCHALIIVQPTPDIISGKYLAMVFQSQFGYSVLYSIRTGGMHPHLNCGEVQCVKLPVPPKVEQSEIINHINQKLLKFDTLIERQLEAIQLMQERRTALISAAVTGKIDVRDWLPSWGDASGNDAAAPLALETRQAQ